MAFLNPAFSCDGLEQMNQRNTRGESYFRHIYGYQQRSQAQALVERLNGTLKKQLTKFYGPSLEPGCNAASKLKNSVWVKRPLPSASKAENTAVGSA